MKKDTNSTLKILRSYNWVASCIPKEIMYKGDRKELKKGEKFITYGEKKQKIGILYSGGLISKHRYEVPGTYESREKVTNIYHSYSDNGNKLIFNNDNFLCNKESSEEIIAFTDSVVFIIEKAKIQSLMEKYADMKIIIADITCQIQEINTKRNHFLQFLTGKERIQEFKKEYKDLLYNFKELEGLHKIDLASFVRVNRNENLTD